VIRHLAILFLGALWLTGCSAPDPLAEHEWPQALPALWEVEDQESGHKAWLFGTVHALPDGLNWQTEAVDSALASAGLLVVEIAGLGDSSRAASEFEARAYSDTLPPLLDRVPAEDRPLVADLLARAGESEASFGRTESWAAAMILSGEIRSGNVAYGVDRALIARGLPVAGLEDHAVQYELFDALPAAEQADMLVAVAREARDYDPVAPLEAWLSGDMESLLALGEAGMLGDAELRAALLDDRNRQWVSIISGRIDRDERPFVAVGAAHMLGENGLPALLEAEGFRVTRTQ